ncbi:MAG: peptidase, M1 family protein [bacterium]|nr:MAG: peptidase, M1 family protein [bacterium]
MARNVTQGGKEQPLLNVSRSERSARSVPLVYSKAPYVFEMMRVRLGDERFAVMVRAVLDEWHGQQPTIHRIIESMDRQSIDPWRPFLEQWIERRGLPRIDIDYAVAPTSEGRWEARFAVRQAAPVYDLTIPIRAFGAGAPVDTSFVLNTATQGFSLNLPWDPSTVTIDPEGRVLIGELTVTRVAPADLR